MASATSGYFDGSKSTYGWYARLEYSYSQSTTTSVTLTLKVYNGTTPAYNNNANSAYYEIQGVKTYATYSWTGTAWRTIGTYTFSVPASQTSISLSGKWVSDVNSTYTPASLSVSGTITVPQIQTLKVGSIASSKSAKPGDTITLSVTASGGSSYTYQWYLDSTAISGATESTYSRVVSLSDNGKTIYCKVTSGGQSVSTNKCSLTVQEEIILTYLNLVKIKNQNFVPYVYQEGKWQIARWDIPKYGTLIINSATATQKGAEVTIE